MRSLLLGISLVFAVQAMTIGAQSQPQPAAEPTAAAPSEAITVTGCLQANPTGSASGTAAAGSTAYVLANASANVARSEAAGAAPAGATRAASGATPGAVGTSGVVEVTSYALHGRPDELGKHLGHRIEITGTASQAAPSGDSAPGTTAAQPPQQVIPHEPHRGPVSTIAAPAPAAGTAHPSVQHLSVQSVRMLAETCK
jgi:hypothetical protein